MKHFRLVGIFLAVVLALPLTPVRQARADSGDSGTGAAVAAGLVIVVAGVYALVALRDDVERYSEAGDALERAMAVVEASPMVLEAIREPVALGGRWGEGAPVAGVAAGWRWWF